MSLSSDIRVEEVLALLAEFLGIQFHVKKTGEPAGASCGKGAALAATNGSSSGIRELPDGGVEATINLGHITGGEVVVVGRSRGRAADLLKCLPSMAVKYLTAHRKIRQQESTLDDYAAYLSKHLEELTWLRTLAEHLDLCRVGQRLNDVASRVLPTLREMLRTQELLMFRPVTSAEGAETDFEITLRSGQSPLSDRDCLLLFDTLRRQAREGTFISNSLSADSVADGSPANACLLVSIGDPQDGFGWLLAVGRERSPLALDVAAGRLRTGSEFEFGTVEATLLNTAAVMLATHARNLAMLQATEKSLPSQLALCG
jgi:hypothetical protein